MRQPQEKSDILLRHHSFIGIEKEPPQTHVFEQAEDDTTLHLFTWWYRLFAPTLPIGTITTRHKREIVRRGRLASLIIITQFLFELPVFYVIVNAPNHAIVLPWHIVGCLALICALFFNRRGHLTIAGLLIVLSIEITIVVKVITIPGGISLVYLSQYDILIQPIIIAAALLEPWSAFVVVAFNILFVVATLTLGPHAPDLMRALHNPAQVGEIFAVPITTQFVVAFFSWLIVKNMLEALHQADRAKQVAALERSLSEARIQDEERGRQLELAANAIVTTIQQVSNRDIGARIDLPIENILWPLGMQMNLFLDRYQKGREAEVELEVTRAAVNEFSQEIYRSNEQGRNFRLPPRRNTALDGIIVALSGKKKV